MNNYTIITSAIKYPECERCQQLAGGRISTNVSTANGGRKTAARYATESCPAHPHHDYGTRREFARPLRNPGAGACSVIRRQQKFAHAAKLSYIFAHNTPQHNWQMRVRLVTTLINVRVQRGVFTGRMIRPEPSDKSSGYGRTLFISTRYLTECWSQDRRCTL
jgi:hypothetical protein